MSRLIKVFLFFTMLSIEAVSQNFDHGHQQWTQVLQVYQNSAGLMNYEKLKSDFKAQHPFATYLSQLQILKSADYDKWAPNQQKAFLINAYNAYTVKLIVDHYPVASIRDINKKFFVPKPWDLEFFSLLEGRIKSLNPVEHEWLRPKFQDFRVHAAVNCASISCPQLRHEAFIGDKLDAQLDEQMRVWLADKSKNEFDMKKNEMKLSEIFTWYRDDFKIAGTVDIAGVVQKYGPEDAKILVGKKAKQGKLKYDWGLNEFKGAISSH